MKHLRFKRGDRGAALVETAMVLPLLILVTLGMVDFGRSYYAKIGVQEATQGALSYVAHFPSDTVGARQRGAESSSSLAVLPTEIVITCPMRRRSRLPPLMVTP